MNHTWLIYTYGNQDALYNIIMSVGAFFGGGAILSMIRLAIATAVLIILTQLTGVMMAGEANRPFEFSFFFRFYLLYAIFVMIPAGNIVLMDEMTNQPKVVATSATNRIPLGVVAINSFTSVVSHGFINVFEQYFVTGSSGNVALSYSKSGMAFGSNFIAGLPTMTTGDSEFENNLKEYFGNCALPISYSQGAQNTLSQQTDILGYLVNNLQDVQKNRWVSQSSGGTVTTTTCADAVRNLNTQWNTNAQQYLTHVAHMVGYPNAIAANFITAANMTSNDLLQVSNGASDALKQAISMNLIYKSLYSGAAQVGNTALANAVYDAQQFQQYQGGGMMSSQQAARVVPALKIFAESMLFMLYPLMVFYALITTNFGTVIKYIKWSMTIAAIPLIYEIISALIYWYSSAKTAGIMGEGGFNLMTASGLYDLNSSIAATASWLSMSTPILAYAIVSGSDNAITSVFGHATDPAKNVAATTGNELSKGNLGFGNVSVDNAGMNTLSANKFNNAMDMTSGTPQINDRLGRSTVSSYADGSSTVSTAVSSGAITDTTNRALSQQLSHAYSASMMETKQAGTDMSNAYRSAGVYAESHGLGWSGNQDKGTDVRQASGVSSTGANATQDRGSVEASIGSGAGARTGSGRSGYFAGDAKMSASHSNTTTEQYGYDTKTISSDTNGWKKSDLYQHDQNFRTMVDNTEMAQHRYSESYQKSQGIQEQLQTAQQTAVSQSINTNDAAWNQALKDNNGDVRAAISQYNSPDGRNEHFNAEKQANIGQTSVESSLGVNKQNENKFHGQFDGNYADNASAAGNDAENKAKSGVGKGQSVIDKSEEGLGNATEQTKGRAISVPSHENVDKSNGAPDAVSKIQKEAVEHGQSVTHIGPSGFPEK
jgi:conjugal transfer mating pair stabilization protein TraG